MAIKNYAGVVGSLLCKFAIIINLDRLELEVYDPLSLGDGRYSGMNLIKCVDLRKL